MTRPSYQSTAPSTSLSCAPNAQDVSALGFLVAEAFCVIDSLACVSHCVTEIFRVTHRLLRQVVAFSAQKRGAMFCEMRTPSICAMHSWCKMRSFVDRVHMPLLHTHRKAVAYVRIGGGRSQHVVGATRNHWVGSWTRDSQVQDADLTDLSRPMLFHAYKWGSAPSLFAERLRDSGVDNASLRLRPVLDREGHWSWVDF